MKYNGISINDTWAKTTTFHQFQRTMQYHNLSQSQIKEAYFLITGKTVRNGNDTGHVKQGEPTGHTASGGGIDRKNAE